MLMTGGNMNYAIQMPLILQIIVITITLLSGVTMFVIESTERPLTITEKIVYVMAELGLIVVLFIMVISSQ